MMEKTALKEKVSSEVCPEKFCPVHGKVALKKKHFEGIVIRAKMQKTVVVEWVTQAFIPKFERYEKRRSRIKAHNPGCIGAKEGDVVRIVETRPLSKTKNFVVVSILGKEKAFSQKMELREEAKQKKEEVEEENDASSQSKSDESAASR
ncbi:30S ribosomal protein S17 [Candidatus Woesearchaeota archaeon]|nr:30S ribosomal protein S17 [Candidatus Woesearchaeota archaeon]